MNYQIQGLSIHAEVHGTAEPALVFLHYWGGTSRTWIALANDSPFGLAAVSFTADEVRAEALAMQIDAGMVFVNRPAWTAPDILFGGVKHSGYGRELSELGIQEFVNKS